MIAARELQQLSDSLQFSCRCESCHNDVTVIGQV